MTSSRPKKVAIVGSGPSGLFAARQLIAQGMDAEQIHILEREPRVGGKCATYSDPSHPEVKTEIGACIVLSNYRHITNAIIEKGVRTETLLPIASEEVPISKALAEKNTSYFKLAKQLKTYLQHVSRYQAERYLPNPSRDFFELSFDAYAKKHGMPDLATFFKHFVSGFGYGPMEVIPAHAIFAYIGKSVIFDISTGEKSPIVTLKDGFQHLMERIAEDFQVTTSATITRIQRSSSNVKIEYLSNDKTHALDADTLILAIPPLQWPTLNMPLTPTEQACVDQLNYYRYPVAVCNIKGLEAEHHFFAQGLELKNFTENLGELALITTRDGRIPEPVEGRLCTLYQSLPLRNGHTASIDKATEQKIFFEKVTELERKKGWKIDVKKYHVWPDYLPLLPFAVSSQLEKEQMSPDTRTLHLGSYVLGGFDNTECVAEQAVRGVMEHIYRIRYVLPHFANLKHAYRLFSLTSVAPITHESKKEFEEAEDYASIPGGCSIQ